MADVPDQLLCPICFEVPEDEIYQCINGHTICDGCCKGINSCPQCRVPFGPQKIRNRALESILDEMKFECPNAQFGCNVKVARKLLESHAASCQCRDVSYPLCKIIGYNCAFQSSPRAPGSIVQHLVSMHGAKFKDAPNGTLLMDNFCHVAYNKSGIWSPVILKVGETYFLIVAKITGANQSLSFSCISLSSPIQGPVNCILRFRLNGNDKEVSPIECTINSSQITDADNAINCPMVQLPAFRLQSKYSHNDSVIVQVDLQKEVGAPTKLINSDKILLHHESLARARVQEVKAGKRARSKDYASSGIACNKCDKNPILGSRYSCLQCEQFNLCKSCRKNGEHGHHFFTKISNDMERAALSKLKYEKGNVEKWKPLMSADITIANEPMNCSECWRQGAEKKAVMICKECPDLYGICTNCYLAVGVRKDCEDHSIMQAGTSDMA